MGFVSISHEGFVLWYCDWKGLSNIVIRRTGLELEPGPQNKQKHLKAVSLKIHF